MRTVANIKRKKSNQIEVHFCDESKLTLSEELISKHSLCKGLDINEEKFTHLKEEEKEFLCRRAALRLLETRPHGSSELFMKLRKKNLYSAQIISAILTEMEHLGYLNDESFALQYGQELKMKGFGPAAIDNRLYRRGLSRELREQVMQQLKRTPEEEHALMLQLAMKKLQNLKKDEHVFKKRQKLTRFLVTRGFNSYQINMVLEVVFQNPSISGDNY